MIIRLKSLLILTLALLPIGMARGQASVSIGAKAGLNVSGVNTNLSSSLFGNIPFTASYQSRAGLNYGAYCLVRFTRIGLQGEILFSQQGQDFTFNGQKLRTHCNYLNIPVVVKYYLSGGLNLQAGAQVGFLTGSSGDLINTAAAYPPGAVTGDQALTRFVHAVEWSVPLGIGMDLPSGVSMTVRYIIGISDLNKLAGSVSIPPQVTSMGTAESKSHVLQLSIGYRLVKI